MKNSLDLVVLLLYWVSSHFLLFLAAPVGCFNPAGPIFKPRRAIIYPYLT